MIHDSRQELAWACTASPTSPTQPVFLKQGRDCCLHLPASGTPGRSCGSPSGWPGWEALTPNARVLLRGASCTPQQARGSTDPRVHTENVRLSHCSNSKWHGACYRSSQLAHVGNPTSGCTHRVRLLCCRQRGSGHSSFMELSA